LLGIAGGGEDGRAAGGDKGRNVPPVGFPGETTPLVNDGGAARMELVLELVARPFIEEEPARDEVVEDTGVTDHGDADEDEAVEEEEAAELAADKTELGTFGENNNCCDPSLKITSMVMPSGYMMCFLSFFTALSV